MAATKTNGVRIGPISLLTLIAVLLLAVLAMLCITTSNAARAMSQRQATGATSSYALEACGQDLLAHLDDVAQGSGDASAAVTTIAGELDEITEQVLDEADTDDLSIEADTSGKTVTFTVTAADGHALDAAVTFSDDLTHSIDAWKITTAQSDETEENLWSGSATN